ncbi:MAG: hypothetical protein GF317_15455 [Candidatus Lokiarchaeota archaeon]|nr:hypothetical protein [Candidatus Lokiarchaeota archaeon]MBD3200962.1 hypothetical protein [Candidatus Lokiarchaeota archaeon]
MKIYKPLLFFFIGQLIASFVFGTVFELLNFSYDYSSIFYLFLCISTAGHFIEENYYRIWILESKIKSQYSGTPVKPHMDRSFFILFSHSLIVVSFLFYIPISLNIFWSMLFGLTFSIMQISNGFAHIAIFLKYKQNTGSISGGFQIIFGMLVLLSLFFPIKY